MAESAERVSRLEADLAAKEDEWTERVSKKESETEGRLQKVDSLEQTSKDQQAEIERLLGEQKRHASEVERLEEVVSHAEDAVNHREGRAPPAIRIPR